MANSTSDLDNIIRTASRVDILEERFDRHLSETKEQVKSLSEKVDNLSSKISQLNVDIIQSVTSARMDQMKSSNETNIKLYTVNGLIAAFVSFLTAIVSFFIKHPWHQ